MTAQSKYITSLLSVFSTFLENLSVSKDLALLTTEKFVVFLSNRQQADQNWSQNWSINELENFISAQNVPHKSAVLMRKFVTNYTPFEVDVYLHAFLSAIKLDNKSNSTVKNYRSDIQQFVGVVQTHKIQHLFEPDKLRTFVQEQLKHGIKVSTIKRKLSSITQFAAWAEAEGIVKDASFWISDLDSLITGQTSANSKIVPNKMPTIQNKINSSHKVLENFLLSLEVDNHSPATIKNYKSDISQYFEFNQSSDLDKIITQEKITEFVVAQRKAGLKPSSIKRKMTSITQFSLWAEKRGNLHNISAWIHQLPYELFETDQAINGNSSPNVQLRLKPNKLVHAHQPDQEKPKHGWNLPVASFATDDKPTLTLQEPTNDKPYSGIRTSLKDFANQLNTKSNKKLLPYLNLAMMIIFVLGLGYLGYQQFIQRAPSPFAFPTSPVRPNRELSFQGRLTDTAQNPITTATNMAFRLYDTGPGTGGTQLWSSGTCSVTPDQDGIFNVGLGDDCGSEITENVFSENSNVWLEVQIATETLTPRQGIKTVPYALNTETVQGYPISATGAATINTILVMDDGGQIILGEVSPTLKSTTGTFSIEAQTLSLETSTGSNGNIFLTPNGTGKVIVQSNLDLEGYLHAPGATLSATYAGGTALVARGGPSGTVNIAEFQNSAGTPLTVIDEGGNVGIGTTNPGAKLDVSNDIKVGTALTTNGRISFRSTYSTGGEPYIGVNSHERALDIVNPRTTTNEAAIKLLTGSTLRMIIGGDYQGGNVGIGSDTTPDYFFDVQGIANFDTSVYLASSTGNVGIGTTVPVYDLDLVGEFNLTDAIRVAGDAGSSGYVLTSSAGGANTWTDPSTLGLSYWANTLNVLHPKNEYASVVDLVIGGTSTASADIQLYANGAAVFNEQGLDSDFRVESVGDANALFVQGSDGNVGIGTNAPTSKLHISQSQGNVEFKDLSGITSTSDVGIIFDGNGSYESGVFTEVNGEVLSYGINVPQLTTRNTAQVGGIFRLDSRGTQQKFVVIGYPTGGSVGNERLSVNLQDGLVYMATNGGNVGLGDATPDAKLEVLSTTEQLRLTHTDGTVDSRFTVDGSGNLTIDNTGTKTVIADDLQITGNDLLDSGATSRITLGGTTTLTNTTTTLSGTTTLTAASLANLTTAASVNWAGLTSLTFSADNVSIFGSDVADGNLTLQGTSNATKTNSHILLQPTGGNVGIGTTSAGYTLDLVGEFNLTDAIRVAGDAGVSGYLLTSSAGGANTWTDPATLAGTNWWDNTANVFHPRNEYASIVDLVIGGTSTASADIQLYANGAAVFNEQGLDSDFRVESVGDANALFVQGSDGNVGIGTNIPGAELDVNGNVLIAGGGTIDTRTAGTLTIGGTTQTGLTLGRAGATTTINGSGLTVTPTAWTATPTISGLITASSGVTIAANQNLTLNSGTGQYSQTFTGTTTDAFTITANSLTSGSITELSSSSTGLTGNLANITLSGSNAANTGSLLALTNSGTLNTNTTFLINHYATGTNNLALRVNDVSGDTTPFVIDGLGNVGIGSLTPGYTLDVVGELNLTDAIRVAGDAGVSGYLLTSSAGGANTWTDPATLAGTNWWDNTANVFHPRNEYASIVDLVIGGTSTASADIQLYANGAAVFNEQGLDSDFRVEGVGQANALFVQGSNGNVGIGTNNPTSKLEVNGNITLSSGGGKTITTPGDELVLEQTGDALGTTRLRLRSRTGLTGAIFENDNLDLVDFQFQPSIDTNGTIRYEGRDASVFQSGATSSFQFGQIPLSTVSNRWAEISNNGAIFTSGNVGIGNTSPDAKLEVLSTTEQLRLTHTDGTVDSRFTVDGSGNLTIDNTGTKTVIADDLQITGNDLLDSGATSRITLGGTTTLTNTTTTLSGTTTLTAASLANLTTAASVNWAGLTSLTFSADNVSIFGSDVADGNLTLQGTSNATKTNSHILLQPTGGNVGIGTTSAGYTLDLVGEFNLTDAIRVAGDAGVSGYLLTSSAGGANTWTDPATLAGTNWWDNTANVFHPRNEYASIVDLVIGGTSTASADIQLYANGAAVFNEQGLDSDFRVESVGDANALFVQGSDGNVGIGTNIPGAELDVNGNVLIAGGGTIDTRTAGTLTIGGTTQTGLTLGRAGATTTINGSGLTVTPTAWTATPTISGLITASGGVTIAANQNLTLNSGTGQYSQTFTGTTTDAFTITANSLTSGTIAELSSSSTGLTGNLANITLSGSNAANTGSLLALTNSGTLNTNTTFLINHYATGTNNLALRVNDVSGDTTPFVIDGLGNVGIGSLTPGYTLDVVGELNLTDAIRVAGDAGVSGYLLTSSAGGANTWTDPATLAGTNWWDNTANVFHPRNEYASIVDLVIGGTSTASADIQLYANGAAVFNEQGLDSDFRVESVGDANALFVQGSDGNVGIGTNIPGAELDVNGNVLIAGGGTIDTRTAGTLTIGGTTQTGLTLGRAGATTTINGSGLTVTPTAWTATPTISGLITASGGVTIAANQNLTLNSGTGQYSQTFTGTTTDAFTITANSLTSGTIAELSSSSTGLTGNLANITLSGSNAANTGSLLALTNSGTLNTNTTFLINHYATGTNNLALRVNDVSGDTTPFVIDGLGNVGIGSLTPGYTLDVVGELNLTDAIRVAGDAGVSGYLLTSSAGGANTWTDPATLAGTNWWDNTANVFHPRNEYASIVDLVIGGTSTASADIQLYANGAAVFNEQGLDSDFRVESVGDANALFVQGSDGNVGIGTNIPGAELDVNGNVLIAGGGTIDTRTAGTLTIGGTTQTGLTLGRAGATTTINGSGLTVTPTAWTATPTISGLITASGGVTIAANQNLTLNSGTGQYSQTFTGTTTDAFTITANSLTSGTIAELSSSSTGLTGNLANITLSGSNAANTGSLLALTNSGTLNTNTTFLINHYATGTNNLALRVNDVSGDTTPFVIDGLGNVGIGSLTPGYTLDVVGELNLTDAIRVAGDAGVSGYLLTSSAGGANTWTDPATLAGTNWWDNTANVFHPRNEYASIVDLVIGGTSTASADIQLYANGAAVFNEQGNDADFRIESDTNANAFFLQGSDGFIGIGTSSPLAPLHILSGSTPQIMWEGTSGNYAEFQMVDGQIGGATYAFLSGYPNIGDFTIRESGVANRLTIKQTSGNVGINTSSPDAKLEVLSTTEQLRLTHTDGTVDSRL
jgi:hypothetical protein